MEISPFSLNLLMVLALSSSSNLWTHFKRNGFILVLAAFNISLLTQDLRCLKRCLAERKLSKILILYGQKLLIASKIYKKNQLQVL